MTPAFQDILLQLFDDVHQNPDSLPTVPSEEWDEGSTERQLLKSFRGMAEQVYERIHQLKQTEQQLREQEELYHSAFDATNDGLIIGDLDGTIVEVNPAASQMYGYSQAEMIELTGFHLIHPSSHSQLEELITHPPSSGTRTRLLALRKDGSTFHAEGYLSTFTYKGKPLLLSVGRDVTERVEAERQLREREEQYRSIFEATYDGINILDMDGFLVEVNPAFCHMFGYTREELIGKHVNVLAAPVDQHILIESLETLKAGRTSRRRSHEACGKMEPYSTWNHTALLSPMEATSICSPFPVISLHGSMPSSNCASVRSSIAASLKPRPMD